MGRKVNYQEKQKRGPGRKAKKQKEPVFNFDVRGNRFGVYMSGKS